VLIKSERQLKAAFAQWLGRMCEKVEFRLDAPLIPRWRELIGSDAWGERVYKCTSTCRSDGLVTLNFEYRDYARLSRAIQDASFRATLTAEEKEALSLVAARVKALVRPGMSQYEKLLAIHDFIVTRARYSRDGGRRVIDIMKYGRGCCEAYSSTLYIMLQQAGIPVRLVVGDAGEPHAWNLVQLGSVWYHVDATWDDPVVKTGSQDVLSHSYFCLTDGEMARTHQWIRRDYPATGAVTEYYYRKNGSYFNDFCSFWTAATKAYKRGERRFEGYLCAYGDDKLFMDNIKRHSSPETPASIRWVGPDSAAGVVIVTFGGEKR
jgi:hypothetical protein